VLFEQNEHAPKEATVLGAQFASAIDDELRRENCEYDEKRGTDRLRPIRIEILPEDLWVKFAQQRLERSGGSPEQYKHPCLVPDPEFKSLFRQACGLETEQS
jgi:hypothetical protein